MKRLTDEQARKIIKQAEDKADAFDEAGNSTQASFYRLISDTIAVMLGEGDDMFLSDMDLEVE